MLSYCTYIKVFVNTAGSSRHMCSDISLWFCHVMQFRWAGSLCSTQLLVWKVYFEIRRSSGREDLDDSEYSFCQTSEMLRRMSSFRYLHHSQKSHRKAPLTAIYEIDINETKSKFKGQWTIFHRVRNPRAIIGTKACNLFELDQKTTLLKLPSLCVSLLDYTWHWRIFMGFLCVEKAFLV